MRRYETIWELLKKAEPDQWVEVKVSRPSQIQTIINMVQVEKSRAHTTRKKLDLPGYGRLQIRREPENLRVLFKLNDAGALF